MGILNKRMDSADERFCAYTQKRKANRGVCLSRGREIILRQITWR